ncbi:unnamed protein product, partial [Prunus brigantina]
QKFNLDDCHKKYTFQKLGKLWRDHRSNLVKMVMKQAQVVGLPRAASLLKPDNRQKSETPDAISRTDVWIYGYEKRKKNEDDEVEDPDLVIGIKVFIFVVVNSRKEVKKYKKEQGTQKCSIKEDAVAKVLGPDPRGRVRGMGFGATASKIEGQVRVHDQFNRLENEVIELKNQMTNLLTRIAAGEINIEKENLSVQHSANESVQSKQKVNNNVQKSANEMSQSKQKENPAENAKCKLLNWIGTSEIVGIGEIASTDPNSLVHHVPLGHECWKVWVNDVMDDNVPCIDQHVSSFFFVKH